MIIEPSEMFSLVQNLTDRDQSEEEVFLEVIVIYIDSVKETSVAS